MADKVAQTEIETEIEKVGAGDDNGSLGPPTFDQLATKRLLRKLDMRLVPFLALLYLCVSLCLKWNLLSDI